jgi:hypothetical protein
MFNASRKGPWRPTGARAIGLQLAVLWFGLTGTCVAAGSFGNTSWIGATVKQGASTVSVGEQVFASSLDFSVGAAQGFSFEARGTFGLYDNGVPYVFGASISPLLSLRLTNFSYECMQLSCEAAEFRTYFYARGIGGYFEDPIMTGLSMDGAGSLLGDFRLEAYFGGYDGGSISPLLVVNGSLSGGPFSFSSGILPKYRGSGQRFDPITLQLSLPSATQGQTLELPHSAAASINTVPSLVPEPDAVWLMSLGAGALGWLARRRQLRAAGAQS